MKSNLNKDKLINHVDITMGQSPKSEFYNTEGDGMPFLQGNRTFGEKFPYVDTYCTDPKRIAQPGDVLMSVRAPVGNVNISTEKVCIGRGVCSLRMKNGNNEYLYYVLKSFKKYITNQETGTVFGSINKKQIENLLLPFPDVKEQKKISSLLKLLDDKIELNNQINQTLEEMAQAIFKHWFVDFEFPNGNGEPYKSSGGKFVDSELGMIPEGWQVKKIGEVTKIVRGASPRPIQNFISDTGMPWVKIGDATAESSKFITNTNEFIKEEGIEKSRKVEPGTLILSNSATPGIPKIMLITACVHDGWLIFNEYKDISKEYLYYFLLRERNSILSLSNGSVFRNLKTDILKNYSIIIPTATVVEKASKLFISIDETIRNNVREINNLIEVRDTLLPKLMSGEIRIPDVEQEVEACL